MSLANAVIDCQAKNSKRGDQIVRRVNHIGEAFRIVACFGYGYGDSRLFSFRRISSVTVSPMEY